MIHLSTLLQHYKRPEVQKAIVDNASSREVAVKFGDNGFGKRPDVLNYPQDVFEFAKQGATSFHASEERWTNALRLDTSLRKEEMDSMRIGWDLILDIDCHDLEYSKIAASLTIQALKFNDVTSISCKFSGNKGFHIGVPFEAFPERIGDRSSKELFPDAPRRIALYIKEMIKRPLGERILEIEGGDFSRVLLKSNAQEHEIKYFKQDALGTKIPFLNVEPFLDIDTILISSRHLYRMPYSFNEKSGLISVPIDPAKVLEFRREHASHPISISGHKFLDRENTKPGEAKKLLIQSFDFASKIEKEQEAANPNLKQQVYSIPQSAIPEQFFPPCIQTGLKGIRDGRKRFLFVAVNFLTNAGWDYEQIEKRLLEWNKANPEPLRDTFIIGHIRYHKQRKQKILPPNCDNEMYYGFFPQCKAEAGHKGIKNPVQYCKRRARFALEQSEGMGKRGRKKKQDENE